MNIRQQSISRIVFLLVFALALPTFAAPHVKTLADGVTLIQDINTDPTSPLVVNALKIDLKKAALVRLDLEQLSGDPAGTLKWILTPKTA